MSKVFENVYGQLLFNSKHSSSVGSCLEYTIHWNSAPETCQKLAQNPHEFLKSNNLLNEIKTVLSRLDEQKGFHTLQYQLIFLPFMQFSRPVPPTASEIEKVIPKVGQDLRADQVISFQCFMQTTTDNEIPDKVQQSTFRLLGHTFEMREARFAPPPQSDRVNVRMYKLLSQLLARDFNYTGYLSNARESLSHVLSTSSVGPEAFSLNEYPLSSLEYLKGADIFLGHDWLQSREDLLEIYPYYHHLYNFIEVFRKQYHLQRTRL